MPTTITDSFNRANSTTTLGNTDTGETWVVLAGTWGISSNQGYKVASDDQHAVAYVEFGASRMIAQVVGGSTVGNGFAVAFRVVDINNFWIAHYDATNLNLYKCIAGSFTLVGTVVQAIVTGDTLKAVADGNSIGVYLNGNLKISATDAALNTATKAGLYAYYTNLRFEDFEVSDPPAHITQEFIETAYRDALVGGPAHITQEIAESAYWHADNNPDNAVRLTMQTVEILYLEPEADDVFDDCGHYTGPREWQARLFDAHDPETGNRKAYGPDGSDLEAVLHQIDFELQERGGYGGGSVEFLEEWQNVSLAGTERVDVWLWGEPAYRGYLRIFQKQLSSPESARPQFYGMVAILDEIKVRRKFAYGCDTDIGQIFRDICEAYITVSTGPFPNASIDANTSIGATLKEYDGRGKSIAQCFNDLADLAPNQAIWGAEMDDTRPIPGDTIYFRAKPTETAYVVVVGDNVQSLIYPTDTHEIVNRIKITGGEVTQPNIVPNGGFEELMPASEDQGNFLIDHDFEAANSGGQWVLSGGASLKSPGVGGAFGAGRSGQYWLELDTLNEEAYQFAYIISGRVYTASCWCRLEQSGFSNSGILTLEGYDASDVLLTTISVGLTGLTTTYKRFSVTQDLTAYSTVVKFKVRLIGNGGSASNDGILVDDVGLYEECAVAQEFWEHFQRGDATLQDLDWDHRTVTPRSGAYCIKVDAANISISSDAVDIYNRIVWAPSVDATERYTLLVFWHTNGAGTPGANALSIGATSINSSGAQGTTFESDTAVIGSPAASTWQILPLAITTESTTAKLQVFIRVRTNEAIYIDDVMLVKGELPAEVRDSRGFWPAETYERVIDVEDSLLSGMLGTGVDDSIDDYGYHDDDVSNELVTDVDTALALAAGTFNAKALPKVEGSLSIFGVRELIGQAGKVRLVNLPSPPDPLYPARASYSIGGSSIDVSVELGNQRPDLALLLELTKQRARQT